MRIRTLTLQNFRNYEDETFAFDEGINVLYGRNAQGKTNCAEAVFYLCTGTSPRARKDRQMIRAGQESARVAALAETRFGSVHIEAEIFENRREIRINGSKIAKNADLSIQTLEYKNKLLRQSYEEYMDEYQIRTDTIDAYQNSMIDSVLIPTYDNNHEYYMSRTKIGIDDLALEAENYLEQAKGTQVSIDRNLDMIDKIELGSTDAQRATADAMIESLDAEIAELEALVTQVNREYLNAQTHNYLSVQFLYSGIVDKVNLKFGIVLGVAVGAVLLLGFYLDTYRAPRKPRRKPSRKPRRKAKTAATA